MATSSFTPTPETLLRSFENSISNIFKENFIDFQVEVESGRHLAAFSTGLHKMFRVGTQHVLCVGISAKDGSGIAVTLA